MSIASYLGLWITAFLCLSARVQDSGAQAKKWGLDKIWNHAHDQGHLPELSEPIHKSGQDNSVAICATMMDENSTDVREWLLYYRYFLSSTSIVVSMCLYLGFAASWARDQAAAAARLELVRQLTPSHRYGH